MNYPKTFPDIQLNFSDKIFRKRQNLILYKKMAIFKHLNQDKTSLQNNHDSQY